MKDGKVVATVAWDRDGRGSVTVLSGDVWTIGPSAAALEFLNHRWRLLLPSLGPSGGIARACADTAKLPAPAPASYSQEGHGARPSRES